MESRIIKEKWFPSFYKHIHKHENCLNNRVHYHVNVALAPIGASLIKGQREILSLLLTFFTKIMSTHRPNHST